MRTQRAKEVSEQIRGSEGKWPPSGRAGWATGLTRAQKGLATQWAAGVVEEGPLSQLVPVDTFLPLSGILSLVL